MFSVFVFLSIPSLGADTATKATEPKEPIREKDAREFTAQEQTLKARMEELFVASRKVNDTGAERDEARAKIEEALDWERVSKDCLGTEWKKASASNRDKFKALLKQVIVRTAYTRLDKFWNGTKYQFRNITVKGGSAVIDAKFTVGKESFDLEYYFYQKDKKWYIYDISFEDMRYSENINEQLVAFLKENPFPALLNKLKKRLDEIEGGHAEVDGLPGPGPGNRKTTSEPSP
jgi:phospholipid transport system substrate-binding protein